uniref:Sodium/hydrogen exchanger n=1 Tax=Panagrellus redivivus TaxID=6233 RepID=A0A7E4VE29_PANRE
MAEARRWRRGGLIAAGKTALLIVVGAALPASIEAVHHHYYYGRAANMNPEDEIEYFAEKRAKSIHHVDSMNLLIFTSLMVVIVLTAWFFKHYRLRFINESGLTLIYGLLFGYLIKFTALGQIESQTMQVTAANGSRITQPPDFLLLGVHKPDNSVVNFHYEMVEGFFADTKTSEKHVERKTVFSPEIFFNIILPPIIFNAGYSLKKKHFFRNIGSILSFVFIGALLSSFFMGFLMYFLCSLFALNFKFQELLFFGSILSATDPLTVLAVFNEMHVEADLYALVFGESALNDAVAIVMASIIDTYTGSSDTFDLPAVGFAVWSFFYVFTGSLVLGCAIGCINALITKFTSLHEFPNLETGMFILLSYVSFILAEVVDFTGIVAVLFCGISQAHYTYNNLSEESQARTKQFFDIINFLGEGFVFLYIGVAVMTSNAMKWNIFFIIFALITMVAARAMWVYPLCTFLNLKRKPRIPVNYMHMIVFSGLRGAVPFALAARNTSTDNRQIMLSTTSIVVIVTVLLNGGLTAWMIDYLGIKHGDAASAMEDRERAQEDEDAQPFANPNPSPRHNPWDKAFLPRKWYNFDATFMKPLLTHANPTLMETMPRFCLPLARWLTTQQQMEKYRSTTLNSHSAETLSGEVLVHPESQKGRHSPTFPRQLNDDSQF